MIGISGGEESYSSGKRETELLQHLLTEFGTITFRVDRRDDIVWMHDPCNCYYVKSAYKVLTYEARILQNGAVPVSDTYRIPILRGYSGYRIPEVSELIILI